MWVASVGFPLGRGGERRRTDKGAEWRLLLPCVPAARPRELNTLPRMPRRRPPGGGGGGGGSGGGGGAFFNLRRELHLHNLFGRASNLPQSASAKFSTEPASHLAPSGAHHHNRRESFLYRPSADDRETLRPVSRASSITSSNDHGG